MYFNHGVTLSLAVLPAVFAATIPHSISEPGAANLQAVQSRDTWSPYYEVLFQTYVKQTGSDPGSTCEIRGNMGVGFSSTSSDLYSIKISSDPAVNRDLRSENGGRGRLLGEWHHTVRDLEKGGNTIWWQTNVYEEGNAFQKDRGFLGDLRSVTWPGELQRSTEWTCSDQETSASGYTGYWIMCYRYIGKGSCGYSMDCF